MSNFSSTARTREVGPAVQRSRGSNSSGRSLDASALQSDIARRFNLPGAAVKRVKYLSAAGNGMGSFSSSSQYTSRQGQGCGHEHNPPSTRGRVVHQRQCPSCSQAVAGSETTCPNCGIFFRSIREFKPTLAEMRGLVQPVHCPVIVLDKDDWAGIEARLWERQESNCPICMEGFTLGHEVLLSCSHMFHR